MYAMPEPGPYRRRSDGVIVHVTGCTGNTSFTDTVAVRGVNLSHVFLENFWKKYEAVEDPVDDAPAMTVYQVACVDDDAAQAFADWLANADWQGITVDGTTVTLPSDNVGAPHAACRQAVQRGWAEGTHHLRRTDDVVTGN